MEAKPTRPSWALTGAEVTGVEAMGAEEVIFNGVGPGSELYLEMKWTDRIGWLLESKMVMADQSWIRYFLSSMSLRWC